MFKLVYKNKKGLSLIELIVTVAILGIVVSLAGQILFQLSKFYETSVLRWNIQTAVQVAFNKFETEKDSITNAYQADVLYDPIIAAGINVNDDGSFTWRSGDSSCYVVGPEGVVDANNFYTYMFSTPAYRASDGTYLGYYMFLRLFDSANSELFLDNEGLGKIPVEIEFSIAKSSPALTVDEDGNYITDTTVAEKYLTNTIDIKLKSGKTDVTVYEVDTQYTLVNISEGKNINYNGGYLVYEEAWRDKSNTAAAGAGPAGWTVETLNNDGTVGYPRSTLASYKVGDTNKTINVSNTIEKTGNVMRFISPTAFHSKSGIEDLTSATNLASCLTSFIFSDSSAISRNVLTELRSFRDNVLAGTEFGDWFIHQYYYEWSPFLIEKTGFLVPVYKAVLIPISYVCGKIADT